MLGALRPLDAEFLKRTQRLAVAAAQFADDVADE
jgi:hypothetical protein